MSARAPAIVKAKVREYLDAHQGWHSALDISREINAPIIDVLAATGELAGEGYRTRIQACMEAGD